MKILVLEGNKETGQTKTAIWRSHKKRAAPAATIAAAINANLVVVGCSGHNIVPPAAAVNLSAAPATTEQTPLQQWPAIPPRLHSFRFASRRWRHTTDSPPAVGQKVVGHSLMDDGRISRAAVGPLRVVEVNAARSVCIVTTAGSDSRCTSTAPDPCLHPPTQARKPSLASKTTMSPFVLTSSAVSAAHLRMTPPCWCVRDAWMATTCGVCGPACPRTTASARTACTRGGTARRVSRHSRSQPAWSWLTLRTWEMPQGATRQPACASRGKGGSLSPASPHQTGPVGGSGAASPRQLLMSSLEAATDEADAPNSDEWQPEDELTGSGGRRRSERGGRSGGRSGAGHHLRHRHPALLAGPLLPRRTEPQSTRSGESESGHPVTCKMASSTRSQRDGTAPRRCLQWRDGRN